MVGAAGIEPATVGLEIRCSIRLSYAPAFVVMHLHANPLGSPNDLHRFYTNLFRGTFNVSASTRCIAVVISAVETMA